MNRSVLKRVLPQIVAWGALVVLSCAIAVAQDQSQQPSGQRPDGQVEMDVVHALDASNALKNDMITAATIQGEVTLTGTVSSDAGSELAEAIVSHVSGVTKVHNSLKVGNPQEAQAADAGAQMASNQPDDAAPPPPADAQPTADPNQDQAQPQGQSQNAQSQNQDQNQDQAPGPPPPPPPGYGYPAARPQYAPAQPPHYAQAPQGPAYAAPTGPVTIPEGTLLQLRTAESLDSKRAKDGNPIQFTVIRDVAVGGVLALPKGATVHGVVTDVKKVGAGDLGGSSQLAIRLTSLDLGGQSYPLDSDQFKVRAPNKAGQTVGNAIGGGILGTIIGCAVGRGFGCAVGAGAGVAAGTAASAASSGPQAWIPAEALVTFHLNTPLTVNPVSAQEAARLAQGLYQGGPNLYRRGPYGYYGAQYAAGYPYPYGYGPVYYRPYFMVGGAYYWR